MTIATIPTVPQLDFTAEELDSGDQQEFITKMESYHTKLENWSTSIYNAMQAVSQMRDDTLGQLALTRNNASPYNMVPDNGTFLTVDANSVNGWSQGVFRSAAFDACFQNYNNLIESDRFNTESSSYGSGINNFGPANSTLATSYANAMGITTNELLTFMHAFAIARIQNDSSTSGETYDGCYEMLSSVPLYKLSVSRSVSISFWFDSMSVPSYIKGFPEGGSVRVWIDGVPAYDDNGDNGSAYHKLNAWQIKHIACSSDGTDPKNEEEIVRLFARPNAFQRFACLRASPSSFQMFPHWMPIKTDPALPLVV